MHIPRSLSQHRLARFIAWAIVLLNWIATGLDHGTPADRRRIRQRDWFLDLGVLARLVRDLIILRACAIAKPRPAKGAAHHRGRISVQLRRRAAGSRLRRALTHRDPMQMLARLLHALRHIDSFAKPLARRLKRRLTRLSQRLAKPQPLCALRVLAWPSPVAADSS